MPLLIWKFQILECQVEISLNNNKVHENIIQRHFFRLCINLNVLHSTISIHFLVTSFIMFQVSFHRISGIFSSIHFFTVFITLKEKMWHTFSWLREEGEVEEEEEKPTMFNHAFIFRYHLI